MLLGPASCAEPQTPPATPPAERPRRPAPPDRPVISAKGLASADGVSVAAASWEVPAAGAEDPAVPGAKPGACPAGVPPVPAEGPDQPPVPAAVPDGDAVPGEDGAADEGCAAGSVVRVGAGAALPEELGDGAGDDGAGVVGTGRVGTGEVGTGMDGTVTEGEGTGTAGVGRAEMVTEGSGVGTGATGASDGGSEGDSEGAGSAGRSRSSESDPFPLDSAAAAQASRPAASTVAARPVPAAVPP